MISRKRNPWILVMFIFNFAIAIVVPILFISYLGYATSISMSKYRDLEANGVIVTNSEKAKGYKNATLSGDWGDVSLYLTRGFRELDSLAYMVAVIFTVNSILLALLWFYSHGEATFQTDSEPGRLLAKSGARA